ncbi:hypothetical protein [Paraburkholderia sp. BCC1886]|uniref:hypothetical protein n=1 Tax=Paraburkholderia sp. BCC1886 TaxID=2562670 RepID=UPI001182FC39|nr:hypothetical protein [Paraburkholderia sp. BCC1886]
MSNIRNKEVIYPRFYAQIVNAFRPLISKREEDFSETVTFDHDAGAFVITGVQSDRFMSYLAALLEDGIPSFESTESGYERTTYNQERATEFAKEIEHKIATLQRAPEHIAAEWRVHLVLGVSLTLDFKAGIENEFDVCIRHFKTSIQLAL